MAQKGASGVLLLVKPGAEREVISCWLPWEIWGGLDVEINIYGRGIDHQICPIYLPYCFVCEPLEDPYRIFDVTSNTRALPNLKLPKE
jgi:hypothetical protein